MLSFGLDEQELEIWYARADNPNAEIIRPDGTSLGSVLKGTNGQRIQGGADWIRLRTRYLDPGRSD